MTLSGLSIAKKEAPLAGPWEKPSSKDSKEDLEVLASFKHSGLFKRGVSNIVDDVPTFCNQVDTCTGFYLDLFGPVVAETLAQVLPRARCLQSLSLGIASPCDMGILDFGGVIQGGGGLFDHENFHHYRMTSQPRYTGVGAEDFGMTCEEAQCRFSLLTGLLPSTVGRYRYLPLDEESYGVAVQDIKSKWSAALRVAGTYDRSPFSALIETFSSLAELRHLMLGRSYLGEDGALALAGSLGELTKLEYLDLSHCSLGKVGLEALAPELMRLKGLRYLSLQGNGLGDQGAEDLVPFLAALTELRFLDLSRCSLSAEGAKAIASMSGLKSLKSLYLGRNE